MTKKQNRAIAVIDAETDPFLKNRVPAPFLWGFYDGSQYREFTKTKKLAEFLAEFDGLVYAHNGGKFDFHYLLEYAELYDEIMIINGRIARMFIGKAELRDSYNILPGPLSAYQKEKIDYAIFEKGEREKPANRRKISEYLKSDCVYLWDFVGRFISEYGVQLTQAGAAMKQWQKLSPLDVPRTDEDFYKTFSDFYYGGRVQCFESGVIDRRFSVYDINSAYPRAMLEKHPYSANFADVGFYAPNADFYDVDCASVGAFPYRLPGGGLTFPSDGERRTHHVTKWELQAAIDTGTIGDYEITRSITFVNHTDFSDYVNHFWALRDDAKKRGDKAGSTIYKYFLNSLYGKWASNPANYHEYMIVPQEMAPGLVTEKLNDMGWQYAGELGPHGLARTPLAEDRRRYYNVATGASITGYVRAMLWRALCASKGPIYCDTDSIAVTSAEGLDIGPMLGQWKHEGDFDRAGIGGKKLYVMRGASDWWDVDGNMVQAKQRPPGAERLYKTASKGVRLTIPQLWRIAQGKEVFHEAEAPTFSVRASPTFQKRRIKITA